MKIVYLSLGSNVGEREKHLATAIEALAGSGIRVVRRSSFYETEPVDFERQGWFLNCAIECETELMPRQLLHTLQGIERAMGRRRMVLRGPRVIDLDILLFGSSVVHTPELEVPHPRMAERRFVLVPLAEIAPEARHPIENRTISELLAGTSDRGTVRLWKRKNSSKRGAQQE